MEEKNIAEKPAAQEETFAFGKPEASAEGALPKTYDPKGIEDKWYAYWLSKGYFHAEADPSRKPFTIVSPPPNITGRLHMGHALDNTMQDILIRFKRMQGCNTLWQPGTDHASIATEVRIIEKLKEEGIDKQDLGREKFLERAWEWKEEYGGHIVSQLKKLGSSCDWERLRFTMDAGCNEAVTEVFLRLYRKGYLYKGKRMINWCPVCGTSISDAEVEYREQAGHFWHIRYPLVTQGGTASTTEFVTFATTRPETMLGDTAVAVHPQDERYRRLVGRKVLLPFVNREIPIVADDYVDREFGTGVVKITPAHDPNDYEVGKRHDLPLVNILDDHAVINENGGKFQGMGRYQARKAIVEELERSGLLVKTEAHVHNVGTHDRCQTVVEPLVKEQWFVNMQELIRPAVRAVQDGEIRLVPKRMEKLYFHWTDNIRDWCVSRQLWWGHRIPAYTCDECHTLAVEKERPQVCPQCGGTHLTQDPDTLDTWFSSALWPFETLGWPKQTQDLSYFYPTDVLVTGYDIIFFWVIRMIFSSYEQLGQKPFHTVLLHGLVRDEQGRKMSKSLGNGIDPLEVIERYGADALRLTLITGNAPGNDMRFSYERMDKSRNFANKVWNASRFILMNLGGREAAPRGGAEDEPVRLEPVDKWILSKLNTLIKEATDNLEGFELGMAASKVYDFLWDEFCDWYIEMVKPRLYTSGQTAEAAASRRSALWTLETVLKDVLKLLHPYMPFLTEEIFSALQSRTLQGGCEPSVMVGSWPLYARERSFPREEKAIETIKEAVRGIRSVRTQRNVAPSRKATVFVVSREEEIRNIFTEGRLFFARLAYADEVFVREDKAEIAQDAVSVVIPGATLCIPFAELVDVPREIGRLRKEEKRLEGELARVNALLSNENFVSKAPEAKLAQEREKRGNYAQMMEQVKLRLGQLEHTDVPGAEKKTVSF